MEHGSPSSRGFLLLAHECLAVFRRPDDLPQPAAREHGLSDDHHGAADPPLDRAAASGTTTVWTLPFAHMETALPELARQVFGQRGNPGGLLFVRTPQLLTRAGVDIPDVLSRWLDQVMPRVVPGGVLVVETRDVRIDGVLQPLGLEACRALRRRRGMQLKEIIAVVPAEDAALHSQATGRLTITHRYLLVASRDRSTSTP